MLTGEFRLRCNREKPCQNCIARDEKGACKFRGPKNETVPAAHREANGETVRQRIDHLENLVKNLLAERQQTSSVSMHMAYTPESPGTQAGLAVSPAVSDAQDVAGAGKLVMDGTHSVYRGGDDWYAVLQEVGIFATLIVIQPQCIFALITARSFPSFATRVL